MDDNVLDQIIQYTKHLKYAGTSVSTVMETTSRKSQPHMAQSHWIGSETTEYRPFLHVEEGSPMRTMAFDCGHGYVQEYYAKKRETESERVREQSVKTQ